tara:strand:- start:368 stop:775 length:408 start_codon:yes stop_codon:yes gene_type:complete
MVVDSISQIEGEEFSITLTVTNPSEIIVDNVLVEITLPPEIRIISGSLDLNDEVLDANAEIIKTAKLVVDNPATLSIDAPFVEFSYAKEILSGTSNPLIISIEDNIQSRYFFPILIAFFLILGTTYIARKVLLSP